MTVEGFNDSLQKGMGRAFLYVRDHGDEGVMQDILHHCVHNSCYDSQVEDRRAEWLLSIIEMTDSPEFYADSVIGSLYEAEEFWDVSQIFDLCSRLAQRGNKKARDALYRKFDLQEFNESYLGGDEIVAVDGLDGLLHVAKVIGKRLLDDEDYWDSGSIYSDACQQYGKSVVEELFLELSQNDASIAAFVNEAVESEESVDSSSKETPAERRRRMYPIERILSDVEEGKGAYPGYYRMFGRYATDDEVDAVYTKFIAEEREEQLLRYMWIFRRRKIPELSEKLLKLAKSEVEELRLAAISVLKNIEHPAVRALALELCGTEQQLPVISAVKLFVENYQDGDSSYIETILNDQENENTLHWGGMDVINVFERNPLKELAKCLLWVYEKTPCTHCREQAVKLLIDNKLLPSDVLYECQYDCVEDIRVMAHKGSGDRLSVT